MSRVHHVKCAAPVADGAFRVYHIDSITRLMDVERLLQDAFGGGVVELSTLMTGECTMHVATMWEGVVMRAYMPVYIGQGMATASLVSASPKTRLPLLLPALLQHTIEWLAETMHTPWLFVATQHPLVTEIISGFLRKHHDHTATVQFEQSVNAFDNMSKKTVGVLAVERTIIKTNKRGQPVRAVRGSTPNGESLVLFKEAPRKKKWNAPKAMWIDRRGQKAPRPGWLGANAFVADLRGANIVCLKMSPAKPKAPAAMIIMADKAPSLAIPSPTIHFMFKEELVTTLDGVMAEVVDVGIQVRLAVV